MVAIAASVYERPVPEGGGPTQIRCVMDVLDLCDINDANQNSTVNVIVRFEWHDPREAHDSKGKIIKNIDEVWYPRLITANKQKAWASLGDVVEILPSGEMVYRAQLWGDFSEIWQSTAT